MRSNRLVGIAVGIWLASEVLEAVAARIQVGCASGSGVVVLPGFRNEDPRQINAVNRWRVQVALRTVRRLGGDVRIVASGGDPAGVGVPEAELLAAELRRHGFAGRVETETLSRTTWENAQRLVPLLRGADRVAVASNPLHALKLRIYLGAADPGLRGRFVPADDYRFGELGPLRVLSAVLGVGDLFRMLREGQRTRADQAFPSRSSNLLGRVISRVFS